MRAQPGGLAGLGLPEREGIHPPARPAPPPDVAGVPGLVRALRRRIARRGPISFQEVMQAALYHPRHGYYMQDAERTGPAGDFITSPSVHPSFGRCLARQLEQMWRVMGQPPAFDVVEVGAGAGELARALLDQAQAEMPEFYARLRYRLVEISPAARRRQARLLVGGPASWADWPLPPGSVEGCLLANELLDSFPVALFEVQNSQPRELLVEWRDAYLRETLGPPLPGSIGERLAGLGLPEGYRSEVNPGIEPWIGEAAGALRRGYLLLLDYGYPRAEYYKPSRRRGTLLCYYRHTLNEEPLRRLGLQDITAHVDLDALAEAARANGLAPAGRADQMSFFVSLGMGPELLQASSRPDITLGEYVALKTDLLELLNPQGLGGIAVMAFGKSMPGETLKGFSGSVPANA